MTTSPETATADWLARLQPRVGVPHGPTKPPHNFVAHADSIRHFAWAYGDDNPLFISEEYARSSPWAGLVAPPLYLLTMGEDHLGPMPDLVRSRSRGALAGRHQIYLSAEFQFFAPIRPGDRLFMTTMLLPPEPTSSGDAAILTYHETYEDKAHVIRAIRESRYLFEPRKQAKRFGAAGSEPPVPSYSRDEIAEIEQTLISERPRGATPLFIEDVARGDSIGSLLKGPLTQSDVIAQHIGLGPSVGGYDWGPLRLRAKTRARIPGFYTRDAYGGWDVAQRVHWSDDAAHAVGVARPYDYGTTRLLWLSHLLTDWVGDAGYVTQLSGAMHAYNCLGDTSTISGVVTGTDGNSVDIELSCVNQEGVLTASGTASVRLASRGGGADLPTPPETPDWALIREEALRRLTRKPTVHHPA
jgi:acyl dehydratase